MKIAKICFQISLQILILGLIGIFGSYLADYLHNCGFFGDVSVYYPDKNGKDTIDHFDWGVRHYWFFWTVSVLFILQILRVVIFIIQKVNNYETNSK